MWAIRLAMIAVPTIPLWYFTGVPYWACVLIVLFAWIVNAIVIEIEDNVPGGWSNPDGSNRPAPVESGGGVLFKIVRFVFIGLLLLVLVGLAVQFL